MRTMFRGRPFAATKSPQITLNRRANVFSTGTRGPSAARQAARLAPDPTVDPDGRLRWPVTIRPKSARSSRSESSRRGGIGLDASGADDKSGRKFGGKFGGESGRGRTVGRSVSANAAYIGPDIIPLKNRRFTIRIRGIRSTAGRAPS